MERAMRRRKSGGTAETSESRGKLGVRTKKCPSCGGPIYLNSSSQGPMAGVCLNCGKQLR